VDQSEIFYTFNIEKQKKMVSKMQTMYDVRQLLKRFGIFIYVGNRLSDLQLIEEELRELHRAKLINTQEFQQALLIIWNEIKKEKAKQNKQKNDGNEM